MKAMNDALMLAELKLRARDYLKDKRENYTVSGLINDGLVALRGHDLYEFTMNACKYDSSLAHGRYAAAADAYWNMFSRMTPVANQNSPLGWFADVLDCAANPTRLGEDRLRRMLINVPLFSSADSQEILNGNYSFMRTRYKFTDVSGRNEFADDYALFIATQPVQSLLQPKRYQQLDANKSYSKSLA